MRDGVLQDIERFTAARRARTTRRSSCSRLPRKSLAGRRGTLAHAHPPHVRHRARGAGGGDGLGGAELFSAGPTLSGSWRSRTLLSPHASRPSLMGRWRRSAGGRSVGALAAPGAAGRGMGIPQAPALLRFDDPRGARRARLSALAPRPSSQARLAVAGALGGRPHPQLGGSRGAPPRLRHRGAETALSPRLARGEESPASP